MYFLIAGTALFFITHLYSSLRSRAPSRDIRGRMGYMRYMGLYSLFAGLGFVLMVWGYGLVRPSALVFTPPGWGMHVTMALMLPALILLFAAYGPYGYIKKKLKHPMLLGIVLWSFGHLLANGELNSLILFGSFLAYAAIVLIVTRNREVAVKKPGIAGDIYAVIMGALVYFVFVTHLHELMIGVPIMV
ncbi:MAG: NnrU family protein [Robiginitomaculum sp.]|nr:NnrU family protein [Robiginitomaculum sp.]